jgi:hypothetical protein
VHVRTTIGALLWVDPVVHASECRRFDSYVVRGPGAINAPIHERPRKCSPSRRRLPANVMTRPDAIGSGESTRRAHNSLPPRNRMTFGVMIRARHVQFSAENWPLTRQSTQVMDSLM